MWMEDAALQGWIRGRRRGRTPARRGEASHLARRAEQRGALVEHLLQVEALQADARSRARPGTAAGAILAITRVLQLLGRPVAKVVRQVAQYLARRGPGVP